MTEGAAQKIRFDLRELSGALADLGVLVPIVAALVLRNGFNPTAILLVFGLMYIASGLYYRLPMPVQPLKAMAAIAIVQGLSPSVVGAAGLLMGALLLALAVSGAIDPITRLFPRAVIRGIQAGLGLLLLQAGLNLALRPQLVAGGNDAMVEVGGLTLSAGALAAVAFGGVLFFALWRRLPATLLILVPAVAIGIAAAPSRTFGFGPQLPSLALPGGSQFLTALVVLVIPQVPLTLGNAVIASADVARRYFGEEARRVSHRALLTSSGLANLMAGVIGGVPVCHGSGGLTAHYRFGARTGGASILIGALLLVLALVLGNGAVTLMGFIPYPALGAMLAMVGIQHALLARDVQAPQEWAVVTTIAAIAIGTGNLALGFGAGIMVHQGILLAQRLVRKPQPSRPHVGQAAE